MAFNGCLSITSSMFSIWSFILSLHLRKSGIMSLFCHLNVRSSNLWEFSLIYAISLNINQSVCYFQHSYVYSLPPVWSSRNQLYSTIWLVMETTDMCFFIYKIRQMLYFKPYVLNTILALQCKYHSFHTFHLYSMSSMLHYTY